MKGWLARELLAFDAPAERAVLGAVVLDNRVWRVVSRSLPVGALSQERHRLILEAMAALARDGRAIDLVTLRSLLERRAVLDRVGGAAYLGELVVGVPRSANVRHYVALVLEAARRRAVARGAWQLVASAKRASFAELEEEYAALGQVLRRAGWAAGAGGDGSRR